MIEGHGDDAYKYKHKIVSNFSSNVYPEVDHSGLYRYLGRQMRKIRSYPEPQPYSLERALANRMEISPESVCVTNGATEAIYLIAQTYRGRHSAVLIPTFSEYVDACRLHDHRIQCITSLEGNLNDIQLVWLCNPNNPTGEVQDKDYLAKYIAAHPHILFIIDQSYEYFTLKRLFSAEDAADYPNVILLHSMTKKYAVPGLRLGYMTASPSLLHTIRLHRMPWSVNEVAITAGHYLLKKGLYMMPRIPFLLKEKEYFANSLNWVGPMKVLPSDTHYMLVRLWRETASDLKKYLVENHGILIRDASNFMGLDETYFRVATQSHEENEGLITALESWLHTL